MASNVPSDLLALQRLYHWESTIPDTVALTQPLGGGQVRDYTWRQVMDEARRMATHLQSLGASPSYTMCTNCKWLNKGQFIKTQSFAM